MVAESDRSRREPHWVTPRIALLRDGRLAVTCDLDDYEHSHEYQEPGIYVWWSTNSGQTWSAPENTGVLGIEPDRIIELPDGRLSMGSHFLPAETQKHAEYIWRSADGGETWGRGVAVAQDAVHMYCEGAYLPLAGGRPAVRAAGQPAPQLPLAGGALFRQWRDVDQPGRGAVRRRPPLHRAAGGRAHPGHLP